MTADSSYWMTRVATTARTLSEAKAMEANGIYIPLDVTIAQHNYDTAIQHYTNPHNIPKGI